MRSSGIKRGLAAIAISGMAVTVLPGLAMANEIDSQVTGAVGPTSTQLYNENTSPSGQPVGLTAKNDGTDTTVRLEAGAGVNVPRVIFQFSRDGGATWSDIATVERNDDGAFSHEWVPSADGVFAGDTILLRTRNAADPNNAGLEDQEGPFVLRNATAATTQAINITAATQKGYFTDPDVPTQHTLGVAGTTTVMSTAPINIPIIAWMDGAGNNTDSTFDTSNNGTGGWEGVLRFSNATYTFDNPALPPAEADEMVVRAATDAFVPASDQTDDFEGFTLYKQVLTSVNATLNPRTEPDPGTVTVTVLDQNGNPIAGIDVYAATGAALGETDGRGQVVTPQSDSIDYYYANADANDNFSPGAGDKRSNDVNNTAAVVRIATSPSEGTQPVGTAVTETITVTDTNGDPIQNRPVRIRRDGPGSQGETVFKTTNDSGQVTYAFNCSTEGVTDITVGISGPTPDPTADPFDFATANDSVRCGEDDVPPTSNPVKPNIKLTGASKGNKDVLRLTVKPAAKAKGAVVRVQKRLNGKWVAWANTKELRKNGKQAWAFRDGNGNRISKYRVQVGNTENSRRGVSNVLRLR